MKRIFIFILVNLVFLIPLFSQSIDTLYYDSQWKGVPIKDLADYYLIHYKFDNPSYPNKIKGFYVTGESYLEGNSLFVDSTNGLNNRYSGYYVEFYKNGNKKRIIDFVGDKEGAYKEVHEFFENGNKVRDIESLDSGFFKITEYKETGDKFCEFSTDSNWKKQGEATWFQHDGYNRMVMTYKDDILEGKAVSYYEDGSFHVCEFHNNIPGDVLKFYDGAGNYVATFNRETLQNVPDLPTEENLKKELAGGEVMQYYMMNGLSVAFMLSYGDEYGKWYMVRCLITNASFLPIDFRMEDAEILLVDKKGKVKEGKLLSHNDYITRVEKKQKRSAFWNEFAGNLTASMAGVNTSTTNYSNTTNSATVYGSQSAAVAGVVGNDGYAAIGGGVGANIGAAVNSTTSTGSVSNITTNGYAAYTAHKIEQQEARQYEENLLKYRNELYKQYMKSETIRPNESAGGYFLVKFDQADKLEIRMPINGVVYKTIWDVKDIKKRK